MEKYFKGRYIFKTSLDGKSEMSLKNQCYAFGFLDGFLDEITYRDNIKEECDKTRFNYDKGYLDGIKERLDFAPDEVTKLKDDWVKRLGIFDAENFIDSRVIGVKYKDMYNFYYQEAKAKIISNVKKYAMSTSLDDKKLLIQSYSFGYIDGFFSEQVFFNLVPSECLSAYKNGLIDGTAAGEENKEFTASQKEIWLIKLAKSDALNNVTGRVLSEEAQKVYNLHYMDVLSGIDDDNLDEETIKLLDQEFKSKKK